MTAPAPQTEAWTVGRLLIWTTNFLKGKGADSPRLDAEVLLAHARGCRRIDLYAAFDDVPKEDVLAAYRALVKRRGEGTPVAYLVGHREFYSLPFQVTPDVLIPRPETEFLVIELLDHAKRFPDPNAELTIADVGTGSGIIAVCAAKHLPKANVTAFDVSPTAIEVAKGNAERHGVADRIEFVESDLLAATPAEPAFDFVVSNPPYVTTAEMAKLPATVRDFEPRLALDAGENGLAVIERLIPQAATRLKPGGSLLLEISPMLEQAVIDLLAADPHWRLGPPRKDLAGHVRVVQAKRK